MFWWMVLAVGATFGAAIILKVTRISTLLGGLLVIPLTLIFRFKEDGTSRAVTGTFGSLFAAFLSCFAGLLMGSLVLCHHVPPGFYWILCAPVVGIILMIQFVLAKRPIPTERANGLFMEAWPNLLGSIGAIAACYIIAGRWFKWFTP